MTYLNHREPLGIERALAAAAAFPTLKEAVEYLSLEGIETSEQQVKNWMRTKREAFEDIRAKMAPQIEAHLANDMLDVAHLATTCERAAIERTMQLLDEGKVGDPSRVARDLAQVKSQSIDKRLALQGRPTQITEHRDYKEIVNALEAMGVVKSVEYSQDESSLALEGS
jgi:uncharacterized NAD(P)/FAD-binding protein YdhS